MALGTEKENELVLTWSMHGGAHLVEGVFRPHGAAPDLRVVEEEQLIMREVEARQVGLGSMLGHPLAVRLYINKILL